MPGQSWSTTDRRTGRRAIAAALGATGRRTVPCAVTVPRVTPGSKRPPLPMSRCATVTEASIPPRCCELVEAVQHGADLAVCRRRPDLTRGLVARRSAPRTANSRGGFGAGRGLQYRRRRADASGAARSSCSHSGSPTAVPAIRSRRWSARGTRGLDGDAGRCRLHAAHRAVEGDRARCAVRGRPSATSARCCPRDRDARLPRDPDSHREAARAGTGQDRLVPPLTYESAA